MRTFRFHDTALLEYQEITRYYLERSRKAAENFISEVEEAIDKVVAFPEAFKPIGADVRCFILNRYPYGIYYSLEEDDSVFILEVCAYGEKSPSLAGPARIKELAFDSKLCFDLEEYEFWKPYIFRESLPGRERTRWPKLVYLRQKQPAGVC